MSTGRWSTGLAPEKLRPFAVWWSHCDCWAPETRMISAALTPLGCDRCLSRSLLLMLTMARDMPPQIPRLVASYLARSDWVLEPPW